MAEQYLSQISTTSGSSPSQYENNQRLKSTSSYLSLSTIKSYDSKYETTKTARINRPKVNSSYVPKKTLSRYNNALLSMKPYRRTNSENDHLPIDSIGCFSLTTYSWTKIYRITSNLLNNYKKLPVNQLNNNDNKKILIPKLIKVDSCNENGKRFLGIYKDEICVNGKNSSLFKVARKFCSTRIIVSSIIHTLALIIELLGIIIFLKLFLDGLKSKQEEDSDVEKSMKIFYSVGIVFCFFGTFILTSITNWINLRTSLRLRNACISCVYNNIMRSSVDFRITPHQIISLIYEESQIIYTLVENVSLIFGTIIALIICLIGSIALRYNAIISIGIILPFIFILCNLAKLSTKYFYQSIKYSSKKLTIVEEFCVNFKNILILNQEKQIREIFNKYCNMEYINYRWSEIYSTKYSGYVTSTLLIGSLYFIRETLEHDEILIILIVYAYFIKSKFIIIFSAIESIYQGKQFFGKLQNTISSVYDPIRFGKYVRLGKYPLITIKNGNFKWKHEITKNNEQFNLNVPEFTVSKGQIIGITGTRKSGKTTFLYTLIGHTNAIEKNSIKVNSEVAFFSQIPFLVTGSLRDNITMKSKFDLSRYQNALITTNLNNDVCINSDIDELPIKTLELDSRQLDRVMLARALYCDKEIILFDEPFNDLNDSLSLIIFKNVLQDLLANGKSVIISTQNEEFLSACHKIFFISNGIMGECYDDYQQIPKQLRGSLQNDIYRQSLEEENMIQGCNRFSISSMKNIELKKNNRRSKNSFCDKTEWQYSDNLEDSLVSNNNNLSKKSYTFITFSKSFIIFTMNLINSFAYLFLITKFVQEKKTNTEYWHISIVLGIITFIFLIDLLIKYFIAWISSKKCLSYQKKMFNNLLRTSLKFLHSINFSDIMHHFSVNIFYEFNSHANILQSSASIIISTSLFIYTNYYLSIVLVINIMCCFLIFWYHRYTILHLNSCEMISRKKMFPLISNNILGRAIIQSFDNITEFSKCFYGLIEENSTSIFIRKSIIFHGQFILNSILGFGLLAICIFYSLKLNYYDFIICIFLYFDFMININKLLSSLLKLIVSKNMATIAQFQEKIPLNQIYKQEKVLYDIYKGLSVNFRDVKCKLPGKKFLNIEKLIIQNGEKIAIVGSASCLIVPILFRLIKPIFGQILFGDEDIYTFCPIFFKTILGIIPVNPNTNIYTTIETLLNPDNEFMMPQIEKALAIVHLLEKINKLPKKLKEPIRNLSYEDKQLICLAKYSIIQPPIILIEKPHYNIHNIIDECIRTHFNEATIIFITDERIKICDRTFDLDENNEL